MDLTGSNICVLDLEIAHSPDELPTGWDDKAALGLSIGCYYHYGDGLVHWFDTHIVHHTMTTLLMEEPLIVSFNGRNFDAMVMWEVSEGEIIDHGGSLMGRESPGDWFNLWRNSYDILHECWRLVDRRRQPRGSHTLDALCAANGLGQKTGNGALAPQLWQQGCIAAVLNYCQQDVMLTKALFEHLLAHDGVLQRPGLSPLRLPLPDLVPYQRREVSV